MTIQRMDHVSVVVDDLEAAKAFFVDLGMELEGEAPIEGPSGRPPQRGSGHSGSGSHSSVCRHLPAPAARSAAGIL